MTIIPSNPLVAGHQPNFLPWFGYFEKMLKADVFVYSDDVRFPKQCYANRVEIPIRGEPSHLTLPVLKGNDDRIADKLFMKDAGALAKVLKTVKFNIGGEPNYADLEPIMAEFERAYWACETLAEFNIHMNQHIAKNLGIDTPVKRGTDLGLDPFRRNERLIKRCEILSSNQYLCGQGADGYQDEAMLADAGIGLQRIEYDLGRHIFGDDLRYSIIYGIAKVGFGGIRDAISKFKLEGRVS